MGIFLDEFVKEARAVALARGVNWEIELDADGLALPGQQWDLNQMSGECPPPHYRLRDFTADMRTVEVIKEMALPAAETLTGAVFGRLSPAWIEFIKAVAIIQLFVVRNTPAHILFNIVRPLRVLATCARGHGPADLTLEDSSFAVETAKRVQPSGKLGDLVFGVLKFIDANHIAVAGPLSPALARNARYSGRRAKYTDAKTNLRTELSHRKNAEKLPERRAFWELIRIIFTEQPRSFLDSLRFALIRLILLTGLRVGEAALIPVDWKRFREYFDQNGKPADLQGGIRRSLMIRHFAEKNRTADDDSVALFETNQDVPLVFEAILTETLEKIAALTAPLRRTLQRQIDTGRMLPDFEENALVRIVELYTYLTGNPFFLALSQEAQDRFRAGYRAEGDTQTLDELRTVQLNDLGKDRLPRGARFSSAFYVFVNRFTGAPFRNADGSVIAEQHRHWNSVYVHISDVETHLRLQLPSKISDSIPLKLSNGQLRADELLFLMPKRALSEGRNAGICDTSRYYAVGRVDSSMITHCISGEGHTTLFSEYGQTEEDRSLKLRPHSLRHLQNTELFRLGVADTIITKRFDRRTVAESYTYDHRTPAEELSQITLPEGIEGHLGLSTSTLARLMKASKEPGPFWEEYRRVQLSEGEAAAFDFLLARLAGVHSTPYGSCDQDFTLNPCPKHLECFAACRHFIAASFPENGNPLIQIKLQIASSIDVIEALPARTVGRANQLSHARERLEGINKALAASPGTRVFPEGQDRSKLSTRTQTVLDTDYDTEDAPDE